MYPHSRPLPTDALAALTVLPRRADAPLAPESRVGRKGDALGTLTVPAQTKHRSYEVAAWWATVTIPEQTAELVVGYDEFWAPATATVNGTLTERFTPSLFGGVMVGSGGVEHPNTPETVTLELRVDDVEAAHREGRLTLTPLGADWLAAKAVQAANHDEFKRRQGTARTALELLQYTLGQLGAQYRTQSVAPHRPVELIVERQFFPAVTAWADAAEPAFAVTLLALEDLRESHLPLLGREARAYLGGNLLRLDAKDRYFTLPPA